MGNSMRLYRYVPSLFLSLATVYGVAFAQPGGPSQSPVVSPAISHVVPQSIAAGVGDECEIRGIGFGLRTGASIEFTHALGEAVSYNKVPEDHFISWSDTMVVVRVPATRDIIAATGFIRMHLASGAVIASPTELTVRYAVMNVESASGAWVRPRLAFTSGAQEIVLRVGHSLEGAYVKALRRALTTWRCATGIPITLSQETAVSGCASEDGTSTVGFDTPSCSVNANEPVDVQVYTDQCTSQGAETIWIREVDIVLNGNLDWNADIHAPSTSQYDVETVLLHALGKALGLTVVRNASSVLSVETLKPGTNRRSVGASSDSIAGTDVAEYAQRSPACGPEALILLQGSTCSIAAPLALMNTSSVAGCSPLLVRFGIASPYVPTSIQWDFDGDGVWDATTAVVDRLFPVPGVYDIRLRLTNAFGTDDRVYLGAIQSYSRPRANAGADVTVCAMDVVTLGASSVASGTIGPYIVRWEPRDLVSDSTVANPIARVSSTTSFVVSVTDSRGCKSVDTVVVHVNKPPVVVLSGDTLICAGQYATVSADIQQGFPPFSFAWRGHPQIIGASTRSARLLPSETTILFLDVTDARGCVRTERFTIRVGSQQSPTIYSQQGFFACEGLTLTLTATGEVGSALEWTTGQTTTAIEVAQSGRYGVRSRSAGGCWSRWVFTDVTIGIAPPPVLAGALAVCSGASTVITVTGDYKAFRWSTGDTTSSVTVSSPGKYSVSALHSMGCWSGAVLFEIVASEVPEKPTFRNTGWVLIAEGGSLWQWYRNRELLTGETSAELGVTVAGLYSVASINADGCSAMSEEVFVDLPTSVASHTLSSGVTTVPQPILEQCKIEWPDSLMVDFVAITTVTGARVYDEPTSVHARNVTVSLRHLSPGVYNVRLLYRGTIVASRLVLRVGQ